MNNRMIVSLVGLVLFVNTSTSNAATWYEVGNAGELPGTAQITEGSGTLDLITGTLSQSFQVDMYSIHINNPEMGRSFTAGASPVTGTNPNFELQLFLFDGNGRGLYGSRGSVAGAFMGSGSFAEPPETGHYYLAVSATRIVPYGIGPYDTETPIFEVGNSCPCIVEPFVYMTDSIVTDWGGSGSGLTGAYTINLTGAEFASPVPVPAAAWLFWSGLLGLIGFSRHNKILF